MKQELVVMLRWPSKRSCHHVFWSVLLLALSARLSADDLIATAKNLLYRDRAEAISILEKAVRESPQRTDYWIEYIRALSISSEDQYVADCVSRAALAIHPKSGELWQARMALFQTPAALDLMPKLEGIVGYEERAKDAREILELAHLKVPFTWEDRQFHGVWSASLIDVGRWERAEEIALRGLALFPNDGLLHACRAMVLAKRDEFEEALTEQKQDGIPHFWYRPRLNWGLADLLILKGRADLAVKSFGKEVSPGQMREGDRLICAQSLLMAGDSERAEVALQGCKDSEAALLRIADGLRRNRIEEARVQAQKLVQSWADRDKRYPRLSSVPFYQSYAPSVAVSLSAAINWLQQEIPNEELRIRTYVVRPRELSKADLDRKTLSASQQIAQLREKILAADADKKWQLRNIIIGILRTAGQFEEAAAECAANALDDHPKAYNSDLMMNPAAVDWSVCKRQAEGAVFFTQHPEMIWDARNTISSVIHSLRHGDGDSRNPWFSDDGVAMRIAGYGPGGLALVSGILKPNTIYGADRSPFAPVFENIGDERDLPVLIDIYAALATNSGRRKSDGPIEKKLAAFDQAIEKITKTKNTADSQEDRARFWQAWWNANARRIITGNN